MPARGKHSSLLRKFELTAIKSFITFATGAVFATLHFLRDFGMGPISRELHYTRLERLASDIHSSLLHKDPNGQILS
jgi:hypothetical protein